MVNPEDYVFKCSKCGRIIKFEFIRYGDNECSQNIYHFLHYIDLMDRLVKDGSLTPGDADKNKIAAKKHLDKTLLCPACVFDKRREENRHREEYYRQHPEERPHYRSSSDDHHNNNDDSFMTWWNTIVSCL
jgi:hypothetical protein